MWPKQSIGTSYLAPFCTITKWRQALQYKEILDLLQYVGFCRRPWARSDLDLLVLGRPACAVDNAIKVLDVGVRLIGQKEAFPDYDITEVGPISNQKRSWIH